MKRMVIPILFLVSFFAVPCAYADEVFKVWAASDSLSSPLDTDIYVSAGERLVISVPSNETWSAGGNRPHSRQSNASGLTGLGPNSGYYWGNYTYGSSSFPYGTLVGQIGDGAYFPVGTFYNGIAGASGDLRLFFWDSSYGDNRGHVQARVSVDPTIVPDRFDVFASYSQSSPLDTGLYVTAGELLAISVPNRQIWSGGGSGPSNADGLAWGRRRGSTNHARTYTYDSQTFPIGALVGRIGDGPYFLVGTDFQQVAQTSGDLSLLYWDSYYGDNYGSVMATVSETSVPVPSALILFATGLSGLFVLKKGRAFHEAIRPLPFCS
jgi:hypothetical protein